MNTNLQLSAISFAIAALVAACGGGGGAQGSPGPLVTVSGAAVKGPINNATVCFYELLTTGKGAQLACTNTTADGNYSINLNYTGGVFVEATGGSYTDETTGLNTSLTTPLTSVGLINGNNSVVVATPLTTLAVNQAMGNLTTVSFGAAAANVGSTFGVTGSITTTIPNVAIGANSSYGEALIGISKMMSGGKSLPNILNSHNITQLQQALTNASMCTVAADPTEPGSVSLKSGLYKTNNNVSTFITSISSGQTSFESLGNISGASKCSIIQNTTVTGSNLSATYLNNYLSVFNPDTNTTTNLTGGCYETRVRLQGTDTTLITAREPDANWRNLITSAGQVAMGCSVIINNAAKVLLNCPSSALQSNNTFYSGLELLKAPTLNELPASSLSVYAKRIDVNGSLKHYNSYQYALDPDHLTSGIIMCSFSLLDLINFNQSINGSGLGVNIINGSSSSSAGGSLISNGQNFTVSTNGITNNGGGLVTVTNGNGN